MFIDTTFPNSGCCDAAFEASSSDPAANGTLSQSVATTVGESYTLSFYVVDEAGEPNDTFGVTFGGFSTTITGDEASPFADGSDFYTFESFAVPDSDITDPSTTLSFLGTNDNFADWNLDDVSLACSADCPVTTVPEPSSTVLFLTGLAAFAARRRRKS